jgi:hypothetical protein
LKIRPPCLPLQFLYAWTLAIIGPKVPRALGHAVNLVIH